MKGAGPSTSQTVMVQEVKVKRKCGRPRNPIPRHKRSSHINAEARRRSKIQTNLNKLNEMLPKMPEQSGRDSKADILTNAVDYIKLSVRNNEQNERELERLRAEKEELERDIKEMQEHLPKEKLFDEEPQTAHQRFNNLVSRRTQKDANYFIFSFLMKPLHETFEKETDPTTLVTFKQTTRSWANDHLSQANLRPMMIKALSTLSKETSVMSNPDLMAQEAMEHTSQTASATPVASTSAEARPSTSTTHSQQHAWGKHSTSPKKHPSHRRSPKKSSPRPSTSTADFDSFSPESTSSVLPYFRPDLPSIPGTSGGMSSTAALTESLHGCPLPVSVGTPPTSMIKLEGHGPPTMDVDRWTDSTMSHHDLQSPFSSDSATELSPQHSSQNSSPFSDYMISYKPSWEHHDVDATAAASMSNENFLQHGHGGSTHPQNDEYALGDLQNLDCGTLFYSCDSSSSSSSAGTSEHSVSSNNGESFLGDPIMEGISPFDIVDLDSSIFDENSLFNYLMAPGNVDQNNNSLHPPQ